VTTGLPHHAWSGGYWGNVLHIGVSIPRVSLTNHNRPTEVEKRDTDMSTPAGLQRFSRSMTTRYNGKCSFCDTATYSGTDFAALSAGKWITVCVACSTSLTAQVRGKVRALNTAAASLTPDQVAQVQALLPANLAAALAEDATEAVAYDAIVQLDAVFVAIKGFNADPRLVALQGIAANPQATPRDRDFAGSLAAWIAGGRDLTPKQAPHADKLIARYSTGTPAAAAPAAEAGEGLYQHADGIVRKVYMTRNDRLACKVLVVTEHDGEFHGSFEYEQGGRRIVAEAVAAGTARQMTQDEAAAFGRQYSFCCNCAKYLDDDRSLAAGYGPTCAENLGWWYPTYPEAAAILQRPVTDSKGKVIEPPAA